MWDLSFHVDEGELVTLIGPNGAGKTTTVETVAGLNRNASGSVTFLGEEILHQPPYGIFRKGLALVPEKREIFAKMPVVENLLLGAGANAGYEKTLEHVYSLFPILSERKNQLAGTLSGGEQQMLAIGRALMSEPKLLILDEPSTGLSPLLVGQVFRSLEQLGREGMTILLLEQNVRHALELCHRGYVLENGRIVKEGKARDLL
ncbi:MAG TPA: ABC transporter ATP-binding protein, partial [Methanoregulaceae archaeon]|nr:ABC transporter ATP-binding protein [Methanoregulaceae archaeon]